AIFITYDDARGDWPFSVKPIMKNVARYKAVTIINRFPAMVRHIDSEIENQIKKIEDPFTRIAFGVNLVTFPINYSETLSDITVDSLTYLLKSMITAIKYTVEASKEIGFEFIPVYPFFNIGPLAGGSQSRLHAQVYIDLNMDGHGAFMENILQAYDEQRKSGYCHLCTSRHNGRIVYENKTWISWATSSPRRNFHLRIAPKRHVERVTDLDELEIRELAITFIYISKAYDMVGVNQNRNIVIYMNPYGYASYFHMFIDFLPFERLGGIEILDSCRVAKMSPFDVADIMRKSIEKIESTME
ncbi:MAG: hypothetical protein DRP08_06490, partial [Candidatus Aenigmatarchaeota archaeon]